MTADGPIEGHVRPLANGLARGCGVTACLLLPVVMVVANKSAPALLALSAILANLAVLAAGGPRVLLRGYRAVLRTGTARALLVLTVVSLASLAWTVEPAMSRRGLAEALPELVFGCGLAAAWPLVVRPRDLRLLPVGLVAAAALIAIEARLGMPLHHAFGARAESYDMKRSAIPLVLMVWPTLALRARDGTPGISACLVAAVAAAAFFAHSAASVVAVVAGVALFFATRRAPGPTLSLAAAAAMTLLVLTPWTGSIAGRVLSPGAAAALSDQHAAHRVRIWTAFERHIRDKHLIGHGFDTSSRITEAVERGGTPTDAAADKTIDNLHPHNVLLQVWIEFGVLGAALTALAFVFIFVRLQGYGATQRATRLAFLGGTAATALVGLNAWSPWWLAVLGLCLVLFRLEREAGPASEG